MARKPKARYLQVKGWWNFQQYPDRVEQGWTPTWIKSYAALLDDYTYNELSELDRGRLHRIWLLAARLDNKIPWDERFIRTAIRASGNFRLSTFIDAGMLLEWDRNATVRPPDNRRKPRNEAKSALDELLNGSLPEESRGEKRREETAVRPAGFSTDKDYDRLVEVQRILDYCRDTDADSEGVLMFYARQVPLSAVVRIRVNCLKQRNCGVGYAVKALKAEAREAA